ncbi:MAG: tetratricopeptide repeat protein [Planctomycetia bacterium]|nr:tetratricopeptide repeat protein [Planctomycetia bacterium]
MTHTGDAQESTLLQELVQLRTEFPVLDPHLFPALQQLAKFYFDEHRFNEARPLLNEALEIRIQALGETHFQVAESLCHLAALAAALHEHAEAINLLKQAERILSGYGDERREQLATVLNQLVESLFAESQYTEATDLAKRALELQGGNIHGATPEVTRTRNNLAALHVARGEYYLAARLLKLNVQVMKCDSKVSELAVSTALNNLAEVFRLQGQLKEAWHQAVKALWSRRRSLGRQHPMVAQSWANLAAIRFDEGKYAAAESLFRRALVPRPRIDPP